MTLLLFARVVVDFLFQVVASSKLANVLNMLVKPRLYILLAYDSWHLFGSQHIPNGRDLNNDVGNWLRSRITRLVPWNQNAFLWGHSPRTDIMYASVRNIILRENVIANNRTEVMIHYLVRIVYCCA